MQSWTRKGYAALVLIVLASGAAQADTAPEIKKIEQSDVFAYLDQLVEWQRTAMAIDPAINNARERIYRDSMQQNATHVLESGFEFSRAEATFEAVNTADDASATDSAPDANATPQQRMAQRLHQINQQIATLIAQRTTVKAKPGATVAQQRQDIDDQLKLMNARKDLLQTISANITAAGDNTPKGFLNKISDLERSIPELNIEPAKTTKPAGISASAAVSTTDDASAARPSSSIVGAASNVFAIMRKQSELESFMMQTMQLDTATKALMKPLRAALENPTAKAADNKTPLTIDQRVATYKQLGTAVVPLGKTMVWIGVSQRTLKTWQQVLDIQLHTYVRQLLIHLAILGVMLALPMIVSGMVHRAITRYISDSKRQYQLNTARRIVLGLMILFILLGTFISDFSSFATFAGFITAGLALALQSVLLSLVAHFFFYGRFGVRAGDRVNVAGVTGEIVQIGMVRFYMRELRDGDKGNFEPTGKIVAFPNSILFQNSAFYKYV